MRWVLVLALLAPLLGQAPPPPAQAAGPVEGPARFKTSVELVTVPVIVRDRDGRTVGGLRAENFHITDNGKEQTITRFSVEAIDSLDAPSPAESSAAARASLPPAILPTRFFAFLIDDAHLEAGNFKPVVAAAGGQLRAMRPGDRAAVLTTSGRISTEFTNDQDKLQAALSKILPVPQRVATVTCPSISYNQADLIVNKQERGAMDAAVQELITCMPEYARDRPMAERVVTNMARTVLSAGDQDSRVTLSSLQQAIRRLEAVAGQRKLVLVSPGFLKPGLQRDVSNAIQRAIQANVIIHAIDARGLRTDPSLRADGETVMDMQAAQTKMSLEREAASAATDVMVELTSGSGGRLFQNSNALDLGFQRAAGVPEYQYMLGFAPQGLKADGKYHALTISLKGIRNLSVEARKGYFAPNRDPDPAKQAKQEIQAELFSRAETNDLTIDVGTRVLPGANKSAAAPSYILQVFTRLDLKTLDFRRSGDNYSDDVRSVTALFDGNGAMVAAKEQTASLKLGTKELEKHRESGAILRTDFDLKAGTYLVRVVWRDSEGQRLGSRTEAVTVPAGDAGTKGAEALKASLATAKMKSSPIWKPAQPTRPQPQETEEALSPTIDTVNVPGGLAALARMINLPAVPSPEKFFLEYCRRIAALLGPAKPGGAVPPVISVASYTASVGALTELAGHGWQRMRLSLETGNGRDTTVQALRTLGWDIADGDRIEPGGTPLDGWRQEASAALGIDEIAMINALTSGGTYTIAIPSGEAQFIQAALWTKLAGTLPPGGFVELFARRPVFAKAYAGLAVMNLETANAVISALGLPSLVEKYADVVYRFGDAFAVTDGRVAVPGGPDARAVWEDLASESTRYPKAFFRSLMLKDAGHLAEYYHAVSRGDLNHQRFFTANTGRALRFYHWFRDEHARAGMRAAWQEEVLRDLPLDEEGHVRFPGGRAAWTSSTKPDDEVLLRLPALQALVPVARLEDSRKAPLDAESVRLLGAHYAAWRGLFPYLANLKGLGAAEFRALENFEAVISKASRIDQNSILGQWHSLVKLAELGSAAGSLDDAAAARLFRRASEAVSKPNFSTTTLAGLREAMGDPADPDEAVPVVLLRLDEAGQTAFQVVKKLQQVPSLRAAADSPRKTLWALAGLVYAATLEPDSLLLQEDPDLLSRHQFAGPDAGCVLFCPSKFKIQAGASHFQGGFAGFGAEARIAGREKVRHAAADAETRVSPIRTAAMGEFGSGMKTDFQVSARVVEANATVTHANGKYEDGLHERDFKVLDDGEAVRLSGFENDTSAVSVALLLDMSRSMTGALATLRKSAFNLVTNLRSIDSVAVFGFSDWVSELQPWTLDKDAAKRALLRSRVMDGTELNDALLRLIHELSERKGRNAIVVFTDGNDTASSLGADLVVQRAKENSIRIYTVAEGDALTYPDQLARLKSIATATGGLSFAIRGTAEMAAVFEAISTDLAHGYLLSFRPEPDPSRRWHNLQILLTSPRGRTVRAREGYFGTP